MIDVLAIGMIIMGLLALIRGRIQLSKAKVVRGIPARLLGALALTPFPVATLIAILYMFATGDVKDPDDVERWTQQNQGSVVAIAAGTVLGTALLIVILGFILAKPMTEEDRRPKKQREYDDEVASPRQREYDDEDDRPRRSRDDEYDDRPRRDRE